MDRIIIWGSLITLAGGTPLATFFLGNKFKQKETKKERAQSDPKVPGSTSTEGGNPSGTEIQS